MLDVALLALFQTVASMPASDPLKPIREVVVEAIRACGTAKDGEIQVCSRDRGFAEGERGRLKKLEKPKPVTNGPPIQVTVSVDSVPAAVTP